MGRRFGCGQRYAIAALGQGVPFDEKNISTLALGVWAQAVN